MSAEIKLAAAMPTLVGPETWYLPLLPVSAFRKITDPAGLGLDYWAIRPTPELQATTISLGKNDLSAIVSASGSYRSERTWKETWEHKNRRLAVKAKLGMPHRDDFRAITQLIASIYAQEKRFIPVVVYPETPKGKIVEVNTSTRLIQPTPEDFITEPKKTPDLRSESELDSDMSFSFTGETPRFERGENVIKEGIKNPKDLDRFLKNHGGDGFCFDTLHSRFLFNDPAFKHLFEEVIKRTKLVHISLGRDDVNRPDYPINGQNELIDVYCKNYQTEVVELLRVLGKLKPDLVYVFEIPTTAIKKLNPSRTLNHKGLSSFYKDLSNICRDLMSSK